MMILKKAPFALLLVFLRDSERLTARPLYIGTIELAMGMNNLRNRAMRTALLDAKSEGV